MTTATIPSTAKASTRSAEVRSQRSRARWEIKRMVPWEEGHLRLGALLIECPDWLESASAIGVICWARWMPWRSAEHMLRVVGVDFANTHSKTVGHLTARQRRSLAKLLGYDEGPFV